MATKKHDKPIPHKTTGKGKTYNPTDRKSTRLNSSHT